MPSSGFFAISFNFYSSDARYCFITIPGKSHAMRPVRFGQRTTCSKLEAPGLRFGTKLATHLLRHRRDWFFFAQP